jgi:lysophospholipase L1-like esterase
MRSVAQKLIVFTIGLLGIFILSGLMRPDGQTINAATNFAVKYTQNDWGSGATVSVEITNNGSSAINGWTVGWTFSGNQKITNMWNAGFTQNGASVSATNQSYNATIPANGGKVSFGFNLSYSGSNPIPDNFTLNGSPSSTLTPSPTSTPINTPTNTPTNTPVTPTPTVSGTPVTVRIMPLGDSITDGITVAGAYRIKLWSDIINNGYSVDFVGSLSNGPASLGDKNHEGHSGWRIDQIDTNINAWMDTYKPQIVLLHIGTNDIAQNYNLTNAPNRVGALIDKICAKLPTGGKLYVAQIIPLSTADWNQKVSSFNLQVAGIVQTKANQGKPVYNVDMYSALTTADLADGVHPNLTGYNKMGDVWFSAIRNDLQ